MYRLVGPDGLTYDSPTRGTLGGHRKTRVYGRLDCPGALRALARGPYAKHRVFFADEPSAIAAGYRPCWLCMRAEYIAWKRDILATGDGRRAMGDGRWATGDR